jgi:hypothetical protein
MGVGKKHKSNYILKFNAGLNLPKEISVLLKATFCVVSFLSTFTLVVQY